MPSSASHNPPMAKKTMPMMKKRRYRKPAAMRFSASARMLIVLGLSGDRRAIGVNQREKRSRQGCIRSVNHNLIAHIRHRVQPCDVVVTEPDAAMRHALS